MFSGNDIVGYVEFLREEFHTLKTDWDALQTAVWPFDVAAQWMIWIPEYGDDLEVGLHLYDAADSLLESAALMELAFDPLLDELPTDLFDPVFVLQAVG